MSDFYQTGVVATLPRLKPGRFENLEKQLLRLRETRGVALVLPASWSEFEGPVPKIIQDLESVKYLKEIVVTTSRTTGEQFATAKKMFSRMKCETRAIWNNGPRIQGLYDLLQENALPAGMDGRGIEFSGVRREQSLPAFVCSGKGASVA